MWVSHAGQMLAAWASEEPQRQPRKAKPPALTCLVTSIGQWRGHFYQFPTALDCSLPV